MEARLRVIAGSFPGETIALSLGKLVVGRADDCDINSRSEFVSGHHCALLLDEDTLRVHDLGSKNGTLVNGHRIGTTPVTLRHDDIIAIGDVYFLVDLKVTRTADEPLAPVPSNGVPTALEGTATFDNDTVQAKVAGQRPPESEPAPPPVAEAGAG
jgi:pSer/pThr/pTyr-binding forkhead associated (FHA) protein